MNSHLRKYITAAAAIITIIAAAAVLLPRSGYYLTLRNRDTGEVYARYKMGEGDRFSVTFIHSVNKYPLTDTYEIENKTIYVEETTYCSFGAGVQTELNPSFDQPNLAGLILPESCKYVDAYAFAGATNMKFLALGGVQYIGREAFNNSACESIVLPGSVRYVGSNAFSAPNIRAIHLNDGLRVLDEGAFFTYGKGSSVTIPASVTYIGAQAFGYCPIDPDDPFAGLTRIDGFAITGTAGSAAQTYAEENEFTFRTDAACTAHDYVTETVAATCLSGGFTRRTCAVCGDVTVTARGSAAAHTAVANDDIAATCDRPGATAVSYTHLTLPTTSRV